jgi:DNA-binding response OmpR family regulator
MYVAIYPQTPSSALTSALLSCGYKPVPVSDVADAERREPEAGWSAAVVELGDDPGLSIAVARKLREDRAIPVLVIVDRTHTSDLEGVSGFDDFLLTPIDTSELRVRLGRLSIASLSDEADPVLRYRDLELNTATYQVTVGGDTRDLTFMEYELLRFFVEHPNRVWSREQITCDASEPSLGKSVRRGSPPSAPWAIASAELACGMRIRRAAKPRF